MKTEYQFFIHAHQRLTEQSEFTGSLTKAALNEAIEAYRTLSLMRLFDQKAIALQRTGQIGTYPSTLGHEVVNIAIGMSMAKSDVFVPYYRDHGTQYLRGVKLSEILLYWGGDERGSQFSQCPEDLPICVPIATQFGHAAGIASAMKIRGEKRAVVVTGGDGSSSKGDFLESINLAGAWHLPVVYVIINNQWAISTPRSVQCGAETLAQKAIGAGIRGVVVDGNDWFAMKDQITQALQLAHAGKGATLIEAQTYRLSDHTTADDASRYRSKEDVNRAWGKDGVERLKRFLMSEQAWTDKQDEQWLFECKNLIDDAVKTYLATPASPPESMFDYLFETVPKPLLAQYESLKHKEARV